MPHFPTLELSIRTTLALPYAEVFALLRTPRVMQVVSAPWIIFRPLDPPELPAEWAPGDYWVSLYLLGRLPLGKQRIRLVLPEKTPDTWPRRLEMIEYGQGDMVRTWEHHITLEELPDRHTRYTDRLQVQAGLLTPLVWFFASLFFRHRQARWRKLARKAAQVSQKTAP
jgi:hypothetical protein